MEWGGEKIFSLLYFFFAMLSAFYVMYFLQWMNTLLREMYFCRSPLHCCHSTQFSILHLSISKKSSMKKKSLLYAYSLNGVELSLQLESELKLKVSHSLFFRHALTIMIFPHIQIGFSKNLYFLCKGLDVKKYLKYFESMMDMAMAYHKNLRP